MVETKELSTNTVSLEMWRSIPFEVRLLVSREFKIYPSGVRITSNTANVKIQNDGFLQEDLAVLTPECMALFCNVDGGNLDSLFKEVVLRIKEPEKFNESNIKPVINNKNKHGGKQGNSTGANGGEGSGEDGAGESFGVSDGVPGKATKGSKKVQRDSGEDSKEDGGDELTGVGKSSKQSREFSAVRLSKSTASK